MKCHWQDSAHARPMGSHTFKRAVPYQAERTSASLVPFFLNFRPPFSPFMPLLFAMQLSLQLHTHTFQTSVKLSYPKTISMPFYCLSLLSRSLVQIPTLSSFHHVGRVLEYDGLSNSLWIRLSRGKKTLLFSKCRVNRFSGLIPPNALLSDN